MFKNVASQKITFLVIDTANNVPKTGDSANLTAYVSKDDGAVTVLGDTSATELDATNAPGVYSFDLTQAETNADKLLFSGKSSTSGIRVVPLLLYTAPSGFGDLTIANNATAANVTRYGGTAGTFASGRPEVNTTHWGGTAVASAVVPCNAIQISGDATAADNLETMLDGTGGQTLSLGRLNISRADSTVAFQVTNSGGAAVKFESTGGNGNGLWLLGHGTNEGLQVDGGATGHGAIITGGASGSGHGLVAQGGASGDGVFAQGGSTTGRGITAQAQAGTTIHGVYVAGFGGGDGLHAVGAGNGSGLHCVAGASGTGDGIEAEINGGSGVPIRGAITGNITGNLSGSVGSLASGGITSASFAAGAITAAVIATDAIDADALAADAIAEINATVDAALADYDGPTNAEMEARTIVSANYALEATLTAMKGATFDTSTDSLEALRNRGDAAWVTATGFSTLDEAGVRTAVGLASANLDTQLSTIDDFLDTEIAAIKAKTDNLPAAPASTGDVTGVWTTAMTESYAADGATMTPAQALYMLLSAVTEFSISGTTITCKQLNGSTTSMTYTMDSASSPTSRTRAS